VALLLFSMELSGTANASTTLIEADIRLRIMG
jgi:hypothetical protein